MTHLEKWTELGLIEDSATNKETIAIALETTAKYMLELRDDLEFTNTDALIFPAMAKLYHNIQINEDSSNEEEMLEKVKELYVELEKKHSALEMLKENAWSTIDHEAELLHYVVDQMIEKHQNKQL
jgi:hypothetical protein